MEKAKLVYVVNARATRDMNFQYVCQSSFDGISVFPPNIRDDVWDSPFGQTITYRPPSIKKSLHKTLQNYCPLVATSDAPNAH